MCPSRSGVTGLILLVLQQGAGLGALGISVLTAAVGVVWTIAGGFLFRAYRTTLRRGLEQRVLAPATLDLDDPATRAELDRMLNGDDDRQVWFALTALGDHPDRGARLAVLCLSSDERVADAAFPQLIATDRGLALEVAGALAAGAPGPLRLDALALLALDGVDPAASAAIAQAFGVADPATRAAARRAAVASGDIALLERVVDDAASGRDAAAAVTALGQAGDAIVPFTAAALADGEPRTAIRMVRCLPSTAAAHALLVEHIGHHHREVALAVRQALGRLGGGHLVAGRVDELLAGDARLAACALAAMAALEPVPDREATALLRRSLDDELSVATASALAAIALALDPALVADTARGLRHGDDRAVADAVETIELHLDARRGRLLVPILDTRLTAQGRLDLLPPDVHPPQRDLVAVLTDLADDPSGTWRRPWLADCARHARATLGL